MTEAGEAEPRIVQNVIAKNGFAYGVIGADIHVFGNGLPLYLLANWQAQPDADREWLRELPSRMLNARRAIVPFTGRDNELTQLCQWRDKGGRLAVRWLYGPAGQGKSRIAAQLTLAKESVAAGWKVIAAHHGPDADPIEPGSQDMRLAGAAGLLMIVDYADRWLLTNLTWLFKNALLHQTGVATRVLMVARTADSWPRIRHILDTYQADPSSQQLPALAQESGERSGMFAKARDSFAGVYQLPDTTGLGPPGPLDDPEFGLTLAVHMAALVAVDAYATGERPPTEMAGLTMYLLDREQLHWARLYADGGAAETAGTHRTTPEVMNQTVFTAALTGTVTLSVGTTLLETLELPDPSQILIDHTVCYPPIDPGMATVLEPLYPDRLAEDFLALTMSGHLADYPAQAWAIPTASRLLIRRGYRHDPATWTSRAITFLASAAYRWPHVGQSCLYLLLRRDPQLAIDAGSAALTALAAIPDIDIDVLEAIEPLFPKSRHVDLDVGIAAVATRRAEYQLAQTDDPAEHALINDRLSFLLANAGLHDQALSKARKAVHIYRGLVAADPARFEPLLALACSGLGISLSVKGQLQEALEVTEEAAQIYRRLVADNPAALPGFARVMSNLGARLSERGQRQEALAAATEAVQMCRQLTAVNPASFDPDLAWSLYSLGVRLSEVGDRKDALTVTEAAVQMYRQLAAVNPASFGPNLARSVSVLGNLLSELGHRQQALVAAKEAVQMYRQLTAVNPASFDPDLAWSLSHLGARLSDMGERHEGLAVTDQAIEALRRLMAVDPVRFGPSLAQSLTHLGIRLAEAGEREKAATATEEAVQMLRRLAAADPGGFEPALAASLTNLGQIRSELGRRQGRNA